MDAAVTDLARSFPFPTRQRRGDAADEASPALDSFLPRAGEVLLTPGQKIALLKMRRSDWTKAICTKLKELRRGDCGAGDYYALARIGLAIHKGSRHVLTEQGRWRADEVAREIAKAAGLHVITYDFGGPGRPAQAMCLCGFRAFNSRHSATNFVQAIGRAGRAHLEHVGAAS